MDNTSENTPDLCLSFIDQTGTQAEGGEGGRSHGHWQKLMRKMGKWLKMDYYTQHKNEVEKQGLVPMKSSLSGTLAARKASDEDYILTYTSC